MIQEEPKTPPDSKSWRSPRAAVSARKWLKGDDSATFEKWAEKEKEEQEKFDTLSFDEQRSQQLQHKFAQRWKARTHKCKLINPNHNYYKMIPFLDKPNHNCFSVSCTCLCPL